MRTAGVAALALVAACAAFERGDVTTPSGDDDAGTEPPDAGTEEAPIADGGGAELEAASPDAAASTCDDFQRDTIALAGFWGTPSGTPPTIAPGTMTFLAPASGESSIQTERRRRENKIRVEATFKVHTPSPAWKSGDGTYRIFDADASLDADMAEYGAFEIGWENWSTIFRTFDDGKAQTGKNFTPRLAYDVPHTIVYEQLFDKNGYVHVSFDGTKNEDLSQDGVITLQAPRPDWQLHLGAIHKGANDSPAITVDVTHLCVDP